MKATEARRIAEEHLENSPLDTNTGKAVLDAISRAASTGRFSLLWLYKGGDLAQALKDCGYQVTLSYLPGRDPNDRDPYMLIEW